MGATGGCCVAIRGCGGTEGKVLGLGVLKDHIGNSEHALNNVFHALIVLNKLFCSNLNWSKSQTFDDSALERAQGTQLQLFFTFSMYV